VADKESFSLLRHKARRVKLEADQHKGLAERQHHARCARSYSDDLGMVNIHLALEPHVGTPLVARAEAEAARLARARTEESREPFERYRADAYMKLLSETGTARARRPELVVLVSHEVIKRGWKDVREGELCKIPGVGPIAPEVAQEIARDAFLNGVFYDGVDLRHFARWTRNIPIEVLLALELGEPPAFDGVCCVDCGNRFRTEFDHLEPRVASGATSKPNLNPRCWNCHHAKTERDRRAGKLKPPNRDAAWWHPQMCEWHLSVRGCGREPRSTARSPIGAARKLSRYSAAVSGGANTTRSSRPSVIDSNRWLAWAGTKAVEPGPMSNSSSPIRSRPRPEITQ
jgi:hypothetical protein